MLSDPIEKLLSLKFAEKVSVQVGLLGTGLQKALIFGTCASELANIAVEKGGLVLNNHE